MKSNWLLKTMKELNFADGGVFNQKSKAKLQEIQKLEKKL